MKEILIFTSSTCCYCEPLLNSIGSKLCIINHKYETDPLIFKKYTIDKLPMVILTKNNIELARSDKPRTYEDIIEFIGSVAEFGLLQQS